ncbi:MAG: sensor histidine kinase [Oliverpabstia sp.]
MIEFGAGKTLRRLDEMMTEAINGTFEESRYDETELSRLESKWKQYLTTSKMSLQKTQIEREKMKALVSDISHQTKTPLANILLYAQLLEEKTKDEEEKELAQQILNQTAKLEFLIQALIKMSRLETDVLEVMPVCQSVNPLIEQAVEEIRGKVVQKQIKISVEETDEIQAVYDLKWTLEALGNILDNAVKYSSVGSLIRIEVKEYEFYVCIRVQDQGMGIPEGERTRIFERFYRGSQVQQEDGIGIGLYLARQILQKEKGYIKVQSKPGEGSCFGMYLAR